MSETAQLRLPLVMPSQAQKHVTVNEALTKLDAFAQLRLSSFTVQVPPDSPLPGESYAIPPQAEGAWSGRSGEIATFVNGGWLFTAPQAGWKAWDMQGGLMRTFDGVDWIEGAVTFGVGGSASQWMVTEHEHAVTPGTTNLTAFTLPAPALVLGVTGRVVVPMTGAGLASWKLGVPDSDNRYGSGLGIGLNSYLIGLTGSPLAYYSPTPLLVSGVGGALSDGVIRLALHYIEIRVPRAV